jgi:phosphatidylglycerol:prolipoprotein diacylglycerol transferase
VDPALGVVAGFPVYTFAVLLDAGAATAIALTAWLARRRRLPLPRVLDAAVVTLLASLVGARLGYVLLHWADFASSPIAGLFFWEGGLSLLGAITVGAPAAVGVLGRLGLPVAGTLDAAVPGVAVGQAVGRLGCLAAGCAAGKALPAGTPLPALALPDAAGVIALRFPSQLVEAGGDLALGALLLGLFLRRPPPGAVAALYLTGYGLLRLAAEPFRGDSTYLGPLAAASAWSLGAIGAGAALFFRSVRADSPAGAARRAA